MQDEIDSINLIVDSENEAKNRGFIDVERRGSIVLKYHVLFPDYHRVVNQKKDAINLCIQYCKNSEFDSFLVSYIDELGNLSEEYKVTNTDSKELSLKSTWKPRRE